LYRSSVAVFDGADARGAPALEAAAADTGAEPLLAAATAGGFAAAAS
jgi:hypothetical protein